jgi:hypothetical protein
MLKMLGRWLGQKTKTCYPFHQKDQQSSFERRNEISPSSQDFHQSYLIRCEKLKKTVLRENHCGTLIKLKMIERDLRKGDLLP